MRGAAGPLTIVAARARRQRTWILPTLALALVFGFAGALASESVIVGDQAARATLKQLDPIDRALRLIWQGPVTPYATRAADTALSDLRVRQQTQVLLLDPVRLSQALVRPVAVAPLHRWLSPDSIGRVGPCRPSHCPVLQGSPGAVPAKLAAPGVRMHVVGRVPLSPVVLGFSPHGKGYWPIVVTGDVHGLNELAALGGVYRNLSWVALLPVERLHSWNLSGFEARLASAQATLSRQPRFTVDAPFFALDAARRRAALAVHRLLLVDGGVVVVLVLFVLLAASTLQRDQQAEIERLRQAGGRRQHTLLFVLAEAAWVSGAAVLAGLGLAILFTVLVAGDASESVTAVLSHGLLSWAGAGALTGGWLITTGLLVCSALVRRLRVADLAALAAAALLVAALAVGTGRSSAWVGLVVPLGCLSAGLVLFRSTGPMLCLAERFSRRGSVTLRLALIGLGRTRGIAAMAIAFLAVSTALAGFALAFRATLVRGAADQAADRVPLDVLISAGSSLAGPLKLTSLAHWQALSHGRVFAVRRTEATYPAGGSTASVPALGIPAASLPLIHGWRASDGPAPLSALAGRLRSSGPVRRPGPVLPPRTRWLQLAVRSPQLSVSVTIDLRDQQGGVHRLPLGSSGPGARALQARVPPGRWKIEAIELNEPSGTAITNGHQNGENPAAATQFSADLILGPLLGRDKRGHLLMRQPLQRWRAVGAASNGRAVTKGSVGGSAAAVIFQTTGWPGVIRPVQPSDSRPLPILVDRGTAAAAGPGGRIGLTVDGEPINARVVGVLRRFPTVSGSGFVVADQARLSGALDAQLPGQGQPDELWISTSKLRSLQASLHSGPRAALSASFRRNIERRLRSEPIASGVLGTLLASVAVATLLALVGMMLVLAGPLREPKIQADLEAQGLGPSALRRELRLRFSLACLLGIWPGLLIALLLDRMTVAAVGAYENGGSQLPLVTVIPVRQLLAVGLGLTALCLVGGWAVSGIPLPRRRPKRPPQRPFGPAALDELLRNPLP